MIGSQIHGAQLEHAGEARHFRRAENRQVEPGISAVIEEDTVDDFTSSGEESEGDVRNPKTGLDIRDLLLDETD
jgi:hypothetical protein